MICDFYSVREQTVCSKGCLVLTKIVFQQQRNISKTVISLLCDFFTKLPSRFSSRKRLPGVLSQNLVHRVNSIQQEYIPLQQLFLIIMQESDCFEYFYAHFSSCGPYQYNLYLVRILKIDQRHETVENFNAWI